MSVAFIYPEIIKELRDVCCKHLEGAATADEPARGYRHTSRTTHGQKDRGGLVALAWVGS